MVEEDLWASLTDSFDTPEHPADTKATDAAKTHMPPKDYSAHKPVNLPAVASITPSGSVHNETAFATSTSTIPDALFLEDLWGNTPDSPPGPGSHISTGKKSVDPPIQNAAGSLKTNILHIRDKEDNESPLDDMSGDDPWESLLDDRENEVGPDLFASFEQATTTPDYEPNRPQNILFEGFGLLDIEAELAEQERLEAEAASQPPETEAIKGRGKWDAPGWGGSSTILYINWEDASKAEQEALERLGYTDIPLEEETRSFIIQAARSARLTRRREKELTSELARARSQLAQLPNLTRHEVAIKELREEIAQIEHELCSSQLTKWRERELSQNLRINQLTIDQLIHEKEEASSQQEEVEHDPYQAERSLLKASIAEIERELVTCMQWVAIKRAAQFLGRGVELDDLIQDGILGVIAGIRHFDPTRGTRLLTAISWWVFQALTRAIMEDSHLIRLPVHVYESVAHIKQEQAKLKTQLGRLPTHQELAVAASLPLKRVERLLQASKQVVSLNRYIHAEDENEGFSFQLVETALVLGEDSVSDELEQVAMKQSVNKWLDCLTLRERRVVELRYGLFDAEQHTLEEIGQKLKLTRERVRQIQERAEKKLSWPVYRSKLFQLPPPPTKGSQKTTNVEVS